MHDIDPAALQAWDPAIIAIARSSARRFGPYVEWQDVAQELRVWWITNERRVAKYLADDEADPEGKPGSKKLLRALALEASGFCQAEKARYVGYRVEDLFFYSTGALRELLPLVFDYECWVEVQQRTSDDGRDGRSGRVLSEGNNLTTALADVKRGLNLISPDDRQLLVSLYRDGLTEAELADQACVTTEAINKRHDRALVRLRDALGGERPPVHHGPGARRVLSNAAARAITEV